LDSLISASCVDLDSSKGKQKNKSTSLPRRSLLINHQEQRETDYRLPAMEPLRQMKTGEKSLLEKRKDFNISFKPKLVQAKNSHPQSPVSRMLPRKLVGKKGLAKETSQLNDFTTS
jgi:hypothetical protein